jgi:hypothetical protein
MARVGNALRQQAIRERQDLVARQVDLTAQGMRGTGGGPSDRDLMMMPGVFFDTPEDRAAFNARSEGYKNTVVNRLRGLRTYARGLSELIAMIDRANETDTGFGVGANIGALQSTLAAAARSLKGELSAAFIDANNLGAYDTGLKDLIREIIPSATDWSTMRAQVRGTLQSIRRRAMAEVDLLAREIRAGSRDPERGSEFRSSPEEELFAGGQRDGTDFEGARQTATAEAEAAVNQGFADLASRFSF